MAYELVDFFFFLSLPPLSYAWQDKHCALPSLFSLSLLGVLMHSPPTRDEKREGHIPARW